MIPSGSSAAAAASALDPLGANEAAPLEEPGAAIAREVNAIN